MEKVMNDRAAIAIPTLNRFDHLKTCIDSLRENEFADETEIYIGLDYPPGEKYIDGYNKVKKYLNDGINGFKEVHIYEHKENLGAQQNCLFLMNKIYEKHKKYIYTEDDNIFSPYFLKFINEALDEYEKDEKVMAVSGYFWPVNVEHSDGCVEVDTIFSAWGNAGWTAKDLIVNADINNQTFEKIMKDTKVLRALRRKNPFIYAELIKSYFEYSGCMFVNGKIENNDLAVSVYMFAKGLKTIYPSVSLVRNMGNDGSGVNCVQITCDDSKTINNRNFDYASQNYNTSYSVDINKFCNIENVDKQLKDFLYVSKTELFKCSIIYWLYRMVGREKVVKILKKI